MHVHVAGQACCRHAWRRWGSTRWRHRALMHAVLLRAHLIAKSSVVFAAFPAGAGDGSNDNFSWNCGVEGATDNPAVLALRQKQVGRRGGGAGGSVGGREGTRARGGMGTGDPSAALHV